MLNEEETIEVDILDNDTLSVDIETGGGGSTSSTWGSITGNIQNQTDLMSKLAEKQDTLISGENIKTINNRSILGPGNISIGGGGGSTYTAGDNIQISEDNVISATDTIYDDTEVRGLINNKQDKLTAGTGIEITAQNVINNTQTSAEWGNITGTLNDQTDLKNALDSKANSSDIPDVSNFITKDVNNLTYYTLATGTGSTIELTINQSTYVMTLNLKNSAGTTISTGSIDLPLETMVVGGSYDSQTKKVILTLKNGQTIEFSIADLVSGLQSEITSSNKLSSDLVDDTNKTNKFVTANEKSNWNAKASNDIVIIGDETEATEDTKLIIEEDDMNLDLQGSDFLNEYSESTEKGYSCGYVNNAIETAVQDVYSTDEVKTNKVWIDGKPIYRKVLNLSLTSSPSTASKNLSNLNIETITHLEGISQSNPTTTNYTWDLTTDKFRTYYNPTNKFIYAEIGSQYPTVPCTIYITIEYTKTTD